MKKYKIQNRSQKNSHSCVPLRQNLLRMFKNELFSGLKLTNLGEIMEGLKKATTKEKKDD
jgi:hypothetical protein